MIRIPLFFAALSEVLYAALDAIGVITRTVARRTETYLASGDHEHGVSETTRERYDNISLREPI